ncbi:hypothetical protein SCHPADRAFT_993229 [Schizopora paradoxa]|uniref:Uncharacterized protein n=1 Tax=Schizopora paradoxa TaxID=27342 RepID=A0A0H2S470_9AGAM|nr:hypothetical protein SCHPADRAFT_993229 [Schizopora paradoxa]
MEVINSADQTTLRNIKSTVKKIEQISERQRMQGFEYYTELSWTNSDVTSMKRHLEKLIELSSSGRLTDQYADEEIRRLIDHHPIVRSFLSSQQRVASATVDCRIVLVGNNVRIYIGNDSTKLHSLWSNLLQALKERTHASQYLESRVVSLLESLKHSWLAFISARYLCHAMKLQATGDALFFLVKIWRYYLDFVLENPDRGEWSTVNECFGTLTSTELRFVFAPPDRLADLTTSLERLKKLSEVPNIFKLFFTTPIVDFRTTTFSADSDEAIFGATIRFDKSYLRLLPLYREALEIEMVKRGLSLSSLEGHPVFDTQSIWMRYCKYARALVTLQGSHVRWFSTLDLNTAFLAIALESSSQYEQRLAMFLAASLAAIHRYYRFEIANQINVSSYDINIIGRILHLPALEVLFENVPYLRRYRVNGRISITSDALPEPPSLFLESTTQNLQDVIVDTMVLPSRSVLCLGVKGEGWRGGFDLLGHYPLLAGYSLRGSPLYVARVKDEVAYHFTCVEEYAKSATYKDEDGTEHVVSEFEVLVLRYNPSDMTPPYPPTRHGAMDPTGPLHWLEFWPRRDADYAAVSPSAKDDDGHLESVLNEFSGW